MSTVLVTGAGGFLGGHVVPALRAAGHEVRTGTVRLPASVDALAAEAADCDAVVHLAGRAHAPDSAGDAHFQDANVLGTERLAEAAARAGVRSFVFVSSIAARDPVTPYGRSKRAGERALDGLAGVPHVIVLRPPMVYGENMRGNPLRLFSLLDAGWPLPLPAAGAQRAVLYAGNLAAAVVAVLARPRTGTWELADGPAPSVREFVRMSAAALARPACLVPVPRPLLAAAAAAGDAFGRLAGSAPFDSRTLARLEEPVLVDPAPFAEAFGWVAPYTTQDGLARTAAWYRAAGAGARAGRRFA